MNDLTPGPALAGGILIGLAVAAALLFNGRVAGISGIFADLIEGAPRGTRRFRVLFLLGLLAGGVALLLARPGAFERPVSDAATLARFAIGGLLVGFGARMSGGCTSGHGVCGLSRRSTRSLVATLTFMAVAIVVVYVRLHAAGGAPGAGQ